MLLEQRRCTECRVPIRWPLLVCTRCIPAKMQAVVDSERTPQALSSLRRCAACGGSIEGTHSSTKYCTKCPYGAFRRRQSAHNRKYYHKKRLKETK